MESWRRSVTTFAAFSGPTILWLLVFFLIPLGIIWMYSFGENVSLTEIETTWTLTNYERIFDPEIRTLFWRTIRLAVIATAICLVVGYPVALVIATAEARWKDFQHNSGLYVDGVCGTSTVRALEVLARQTGTGPGITAMRELELLTASARSLSELRIVVGQFGGLSALTRQLVQALRQRSATVVASDEPDAAAQAAVANRFAATVYIGFEAQTGPRTTIHYYAVPQFESAGGRALAHRLAGCCERAAADLHPQVEGMRLPVLRETRMPAVLFTLGAIQQALDHAPLIVQAVVEALEEWGREPLLSPT